MIRLLDLGLNKFLNFNKIMMITQYNKLLKWVSKKIIKKQNKFEQNCKNNLKLQDKISILLHSFKMSNHQV